MSDRIQIRCLGEDEGDRAWAARFIAERWGAETVVGHGTVYQPASLPGFVTWEQGERVGLVTFHLKREACEIVTIDSEQPGMGVGTRLVEAVRRVAQEAGCRRIWLITTNDNLEALGFYQKQGFVLAALHRNALEVSRRLKPEIPLIGRHGIPLRDEIELEMLLE